MEKEIKEFKKEGLKATIMSALGITILAAISISLSIYKEAASVTILLIFVYGTVLSGTIAEYLNIIEEIKNRVLVKELLEEGQVHINLTLYDTGEITVGWIRADELYSVSLYDSYTFPIKYRQRTDNKECVTRQMEIDDDLEVTVIG